MNKQIAIIYVLIASMILNVFVSNFDALAANIDNKCTNPSSASPLLNNNDNNSSGLARKSCHPCRR